MFARGGYNWILGTLLVISLLLLLYQFLGSLSLLLISIILLVFLCFLLVFFRDPERKPGAGIVSPADGRILSVSMLKLGVNHTKNINGQSNPGVIRIATFMNVTNVHVNRAPMTGQVLSLVHKPGRLLPAYKEESKRNERFVTILLTSIGKIKMIQIAGLIAQRIVPYIHHGQKLKKGQRIGIIQFGSRVDLILPQDKIRVKVIPGQRVWAGVTTLAEIIRS